MSFNKSDEDENGFTFIWKIKNFSVCSVNRLGCMPSPSFQIEMLCKTKWELRLNTNVSKDIILNLFRQRGDSGPVHGINVDVKLFLVNRKGYRITHSKRNLVVSRGGSLADPLKVTHRSIFEETELLIPEDILIVGCHLTNKDTCHKVVCNASTETTAEKFFFSIPVAFPSKDIQPTQIITIPLISSSSKYPEFRIEIESRDFPASKEKIIPRILMGKSSVPIVAVCKMEFQDTNGRVKYSFKEEHCYIAEKDSQAWQLSTKETSNQEDLPDCSNMNFILHFNFSISDGTTHSSIENTVFCPSTLVEKNGPSKHSAQKKLRGLHTDKTFCDFVFRVDGKEFPVHKAVLGIASPVFYAMFDRDMKEKAISESVIEDIEADIMERLIEFIYTDAVDDLHLDNAIKLYSAADKYQIWDLKRNCAELISSNLNVENVTDALSMADMYQDDYLKKTADNFLYANSKEVFRSEKWKVFMENNLNVAAKSMHEICIKMTEIL